MIEFEGMQMRRDIARRALERYDRSMIPGRESERRGG